MLITDRGEPIAELRPAGLTADDLERQLFELEADGKHGSEIAERRALQYFEPIKGTGASASEAIIEEREDRF